LIFECVAPLRLLIWFSGLPHAIPNAFNESTHILGTAYHFFGLVDDYCARKLKARRCRDLAVSLSYAIAIADFKMG
jgi:hypothetical protein